jgi:hypothetical protein
MSASSRLKRESFAHSAKVSQIHAPGRPKREFFERSEKVAR